MTYQKIYALARNIDRMDFVSAKPRPVIADPPGVGILVIHCDSGLVDLVNAPFVPGWVGIDLSLSTGGAKFATNNSGETVLITTVVKNNNYGNPGLYNIVCFDAPSFSSSSAYLVGTTRPEFTGDNSNMSFPLKTLCSPSNNFVTVAYKFRGLEGTCDMSYNTLIFWNKSGLYQEYFTDELPQPDPPNPYNTHQIPPGFNGMCVSHDNSGVFLWLTDPDGVETEGLRPVVTFPTSSKIVFCGFDGVTYEQYSITDVPSEYATFSIGEGPYQGTYPCIPGGVVSLPSGTYCVNDNGYLCKLENGAFRGVRLLDGYDIRHWFRYNSSGLINGCSNPVNGEELYFYNSDNHFYRDEDGGYGINGQCVSKYDFTSDTITDLVKSYPWYGDVCDDLITVDCVRSDGQELYGVALQENVRSGPVYYLNAAVCKYDNLHGVYSPIFKFICDRYDNTYETIMLSSFGQADDPPVTLIDDNSICVNLGDIPTTGSFSFISGVVPSPETSTCSTSFISGVGKQSSVPESHSFQSGVLETEQKTESTSFVTGVVTPDTSIDSFSFDTQVAEGSQTNSYSFKTGAAATPPSGKILICEANGESGYWVVDTSQPSNAQHISISDSLTTACVGSDGNVYAAAMSGVLYRLDPHTLLGASLPGSVNVGSYAHGALARPDGNTSFVTYYGNDYSVNLEGVLQHQKDLTTNGIFAVPCSDGLGYFTSSWSARGRLTYVPYEFSDNPKVAEYPGASETAWGVTTSVSGYTYACSPAGEVFELTGDYESGFALDRIALIPGAFLAAISGDTSGGLWVAGYYAGDEVNLAGRYLFKIVGGNVEFYPLTLGSASSDKNNPNSPVYMICDDNNNLWISDRRQSAPSYLWKVSADNPTSPNSYPLANCANCWELLYVRTGGDEETISSSFTTGAITTSSISCSFHTSIPNVDKESHSFSTNVLQPELVSESQSFSTTILQPETINDSSSFLTGVTQPKQTASHSFVTGAFSKRTESHSFRTQISTVSSISSGLSTRIPVVSQSISSGLEVDVMYYAPFPAGSVVDPGNQLLPTLVTGGSFIVSNVVTNPSIDPTTTPYAVGYSLRAVTSLNTCDILEWELRLNREGGEFTVLVKTTVALPATFSLFTICGITGTVIDTGTVSGSRKYGYIRGIVGDSGNLDKELILVSQGSILQQLIPNGNVTVVPAASWTTLGAAAQAIGFSAGISVSWMTTDLPLIDAFVQTGMKVRSALESLASRVAARLLYAGGNKWVITTPNVKLGAWEGYPHCSVIKNRVGPIKHGNYGMQAAMIPAKVLTGFAGKVTEVPLYTLFTIPVPPVYHLASFETSPDSDKPPIYIPVPSEFNSALHAITPQARAQILVNAADVGPQYTTTDHKEWYPIGIPVVKDYAGVQKLQISGSLFPPSVNSNQFNLGYVVDTTGREAALNQARAESAAKKLLQNQNLSLKLTYYPLKTVTVDSVFFNSVPMPGNYATITYDDMVDWTGQVDTVTIRGDRNGASMSTSFVQWGIVDVAAPLVNIDERYVI